MTTEDRIAQGINITMVLLLGILFLGFMSWGVVTEFPRVREIYVSLPAADRERLGHFLNSVLLLVMGLAFAVRFAGWLIGRLKHPANATRT